MGVGEGLILSSLLCLTHTCCSVHYTGVDEVDQVESLIWRPQSWVR